MDENLLHVVHCPRGLKNIPRTRNSFNSASLVTKLYYTAVDIFCSAAPAYKSVCYARRSDN